MYRHGLSILLFLAVCSACQVGPKYTKPVTPIPQTWKNRENSQPIIRNVDNWWEIFDDVNLNELECQAIHHNKDVYAAFEKIIQARALAGIERSDIFPQLTLEPFYGNENILWMHYHPTRVRREHRRRNEIPFVLNYEIDLWGKLQQAYESAFLNAESEAEVFRTTLLILTTDLAESYFQIRAYDADIKLLEETAESREKAFGIVNSRYEGKITNYSDVSRAEFEYKTTLAKCYAAKRLRDLEENKIAVLLGIPASLFKIDFMPLEQLPPVIPAGVPSDILLQRPDIAEAELTRGSEHAMIGVAYASFFPSISLTGFLGFSSPELKDFLSWKSRLWGMGASAFQTIFDAGELQSNLAFAIAKFREADAEYQQQVLEAFQEVEDALANLEGFKREYDSIEQSVKAAKKTYQIASDRYTKGITFYLDVVDSERQELDAERSLIDLLGKRYAATIQLIKALGGNW